MTPLDAWPLVDTFLAAKTVEVELSVVSDSEEEEAKDEEEEDDEEAEESSMLLLIMSSVDNTLLSFSEFVVAATAKQLAP